MIFLFVCLFSYFFLNSTASSSTRVSPYSRLSPSLLPHHSPPSSNRSKGRGLVEFSGLCPRIASCPLKGPRNRTTAHPPMWCHRMETESSLMNSFCLQNVFFPRSVFFHRTAILPKTVFTPKTACTPRTACCLKIISIQKTATTLKNASIHKIASTLKTASCPRTPWSRQKN